MLKTKLLESGILVQQATNNTKPIPALNKSSRATEPGRHRRAATKPVSRNPIPSHGVPPSM